jgi:methionyl-tRNA formyltransferase
MRLIFAGTPQLAADVLLELSQVHQVVLVITRKDSMIGRKRELSPSPVARAAISLGLPMIKANRIGESEEQAIAKVDADLGIVVAYGTMISDVALHAKDWWNVHFSLLPSWRGATPAQHAILHGYGGGVSIFRLESKLDSGPVVGSIPLPNRPEETAGEYLSRLTAASVPLLLDCLERRPVPADQQGAVSFAPKVQMADARLEFSMTAPALERKVLAMNPEPGAWCTAGGARLKVLRATAIDVADWPSMQEHPLAVGRLHVHNGQVLVGCGGGTLLELKSVQPAGKREMSASDWQHGSRNVSVLE